LHGAGDVHSQPLNVVTANANRFHVAVRRKNAVHVESIISLRNVDIEITTALDHAISDPSTWRGRRCSGRRLWQGHHPRRHRDEVRIPHERNVHPRKIRIIGGSGASFNLDVPRYVDAVIRHDSDIFNIGVGHFDGKIANLRHPAVQYHSGRHDDSGWKL
jgi:hypothetical protein